MAENEKTSKRKYHMKDVELSGEVVLCYFCKEPIRKKRDLSKVLVPLKTKKTRDVERIVHLKCATEFMDKIEYEEETLKENDEWDKCYRAYKKMVGIPDDKSLSRYAVNRLRGLYNDDFISRGKNVTNTKGGYSYETIRMTILRVSHIVQRALSAKNIDNDIPRTNYVMAIIRSHIDDVERKMYAQKQQERALDNMDKRKLDKAFDEVKETYVKPASYTTKAEEIENSWKSKPRQKTEFELEEERRKRETEELESLFD